MAVILSSSQCVKLTDIAATARARNSTKPILWNVCALLHKSERKRKINCSLSQVHILINVPYLQVALNVLSCYSTSCLKESGHTQRGYHYSDVIISTMAFQITSVSIVCSTGADKKKTPKLPVTGLCEGNPSADSPHNGPATRKMFPLDDFIMVARLLRWSFTFETLNVPQITPECKICGSDIVAGLILEACHDMPTLGRYQLDAICSDVLKISKVTGMIMPSIGNFFALLALCGGIHRPPVDFPQKGQWRGALMFSLFCAWTNG